MRLGLLAGLVVLGASCSDGRGVVVVSRAGAQSTCVVVSMSAGGLERVSEPRAFEGQGTLLFGFAQRQETATFPNTVTVLAKGFRAASCTREGVAMLQAIETASGSFDFSKDTQLVLSLRGDGVDGGVNDGGSTSTDGGRDAGTADAGPVDSGTVDSGTVDSGTIDAGAVDAGSLDAGPVDSGTIDAGTIDAGTVDAGTNDAGRADSGLPDSGVDAGRVDAGRVFVVPQYLGVNTIGGRASFNVSLSTAPVAPVTIGVRSQDSAVLTVDVSALTFTPNDWSQPHTVTVTGRDAPDAGILTRIIFLDPAQSTDLQFAGVAVPDVFVRNTTAVCPAPPRALSLWSITPGVDESYSTPPTYLLDRRCTVPTFSRVGYCLQLDPLDGGGTMFAYAEMDDFTGGNLEATQLPFGTFVKRPVRNVSVVSNVESVIPVTRVAGNLEFAPSGYTPGPDGLFDWNDTGFSSLNGWGSFQVFANRNTVFAWNRWALMGTADDVGIGPGPGLLPDWTAAANANDFTARRLSAFAIPAPGVDLVARDGGFTVEEGQPAAGGAVFAVALPTQPTANVTVSVNLSDSSQATVSPATLTFTETNWPNSQFVTVNAIDDLSADGIRRITMSVGRTQSADPKYQNIDGDEVVITVLDNEGTGGVATDTPRVFVQEGQMTSFGVRGISSPGNNVSVTFSNDGGLMTTTSLSFNAGTFQSPQTFNIMSTSPMTMGCKTVTVSASANGGMYSFTNLPVATVTVIDRSGAWPTCKALRDDPACGRPPSGVYFLKLGSSPPFEAYCDMSTSGGGWTRVGYEPEGVEGTFRLLSQSVGMPPDVSKANNPGFIGPRFSFDAGHYREVRIDWTPGATHDAGCGSNFDSLSFTATQELFDNSVALAMPIQNLTTTQPRLFDWVANGDGGVFCRATTTTVRPGDTSWAIKPATDTNTGCGCNSTNWNAEGAFYGGTGGSMCTACGCFGGGWVGDKGIGEPKGGLKPNTTSLFIR